MGRKAKLKKERKQENESIDSSSKPENSHNFVKKMARLGYGLNNVERPPEIPENKIEPQL